MFQPIIQKFKVLWLILLESYSASDQAEIVEIHWDQDGETEVTTAIHMKGIALE